MWKISHVIALKLKRVRRASTLRGGLALGVVAWLERGDCPYGRGSPGPGVEARVARGATCREWGG